MAEADWDEVTYLRKKPQRAADAKSQKVTGSFRGCFQLELIYNTSCMHVEGM